MLRNISTTWCVAILLGAANAARSAIVDYTISYDPTSGTTTLINELDSAEDLPFWTQFGPDSGELLGVSPGSTATVDAAGDVSGPITKGGRCPNNKKGRQIKGCNREGGCFVRLTRQGDN